MGGAWEGEQKKMGGGQSGVGRGKANKNLYTYLIRVKYLQDR